MSNTMSIGVALDYPITLRGGVGVIVESLIQNLSLNYDITLISPDAPEDLQPHPCAPRLHGHIRFDHAQMTRNSARTLADTIAAHKLALVHFHGGGHFSWGARSGYKSPLPFLRKAGIPCVYSAHQIGSLIEGYCAPSRSLVYKLALLPAVWLASAHTLSQAAQIVTDSEHDAKQLRRNYPLLARKIDFIYHSRLSEYTNAMPVASGREPTILSVGHVAFRKGQHILAEAFARIADRFPEWKLVIAGPVLEAACGEAIERTRALHNLQTRILPIGSHTTPYQLMERAGIFVQPSLIEAFGLALQEAMFCGCPCLGTQTGGIPELITHEKTGVLCPPNNPDAMAEALAGLLRDAVRRETLGREARAEVLRRGMTGRAMAANYERIYERVLESHH